MRKYPRSKAAGLEVYSTGSLDFISASEVEVLLEWQERIDKVMDAADKRAHESKPAPNAEVFSAEDFHECREQGMTYQSVAKVANRLLAERATRVEGCLNFNDETIWRVKANEPTHTALLLNVRPVRKESAEDLLREYIQAFDNAEIKTTLVTSWVKRARTLLKDGGKQINV